MKLPAAVRRKVDALYTRSRLRKLELFEQLCRPPQGGRILDIGLTTAATHAYDNLLEQRLSRNYGIVGLSVDHPARLRGQFASVRLVQGDGRQLPFADASFDAVHSNAVIEHVGGEEDQRRFVHEVVRVGRSGFLTTPNFWFPIEQHLALPFVHFLPWPVRARLLRVLYDESTVRYMRSVRLLSAGAFRRFFPPGVTVEIHRLRTTFWPEQLIATFRKDTSDAPRSAA